MREILFQIPQENVAKLCLALGRKGYSACEQDSGGGAWNLGKNEQALAGWKTAGFTYQLELGGEKAAQLQSWRIRAIKVREERDVPETKR